MMVIATIPVFNVLAVISLEFFRGGKCDFKRVALGVLKNPLILGLRHWLSGVKIAL